MKPSTQSSIAGRAKARSATVGAQASSSKPTVTRPSPIQPGYVASKSKTDSGMLHQSRTLEAPAADKPQERRETRRGGRANGKLVGNMVEVSGVAAAAPVTPTCPSGQGGESTGRKAGTCQGQNRVFVLGKHQQSLMPCHPARARQLLQGKAVVHRLYPFVIRLKHRVSGVTQPTIVKLDPGARTTGIAVVRAETSNPKTQYVLFAAELTHRGTYIRDSLTQRRAFRRSRRGRKTRYRAPRFLNRGGDKQGWLPPSLRHRVEGTQSWVGRMGHWAPIGSLALESVRFDTQLLANPDISGVEYQQGTLAGYEVREYVFEKWGRQCAYCPAEHLPLNLDHIVPRARGGSNRVGNLVPSCIKCNTRKDQQDVRTFLAKDPVRLARILQGVGTPMAAAAAVNATRFALRDALRSTGLPVATSSGGRTKWNRSRFGLPKTHAIDAACVGEVDQLHRGNTRALGIRGCGRGSRQRTRLTAQGFPRGYLAPQKLHYGFRTGDMVVARVPKGKKVGVHRGRVAVRATGSFNIQTASGVVQGISHRHCFRLQTADGYAYNIGGARGGASSRPVNGAGIHAVLL